GLMLALNAGAPILLRIVGLPAAIVFAAVPWGWTLVGPMMLVALLGVAPLIGRLGLVRLAVIACGASVLVAVVATSILGARYTGLDRWGSVNALLRATSNRCQGPGCSPNGVSGIERTVYRAVNERRVALWHDAWEIMWSHPVIGVGPGRFD